MRWQDERYVRVYTRDTSEWVALSWEARSIFLMMLRIADRAGIIMLGKKSLRGLAVMMHLPPDVLERAVMELAEDTCISCDGERIVIRNFIDAQEVPISDAQRKRDQRERDRAKALLHSGERPAVSLAVPGGHEESLLPSLSSRDEPSEPPEPQKIASGSAAPHPAKEPKGTKATNPRHTPLVRALTDEWERIRRSKYGFAKGKDAAAVTTLLGFGSDEEILRRWRTAIGHRDKRERADSLAVFASRWNAYDSDTPRGQLSDVRKGYARADESDWSGDGGYGEINKSGGGP